MFQDKKTKRNTQEHQVIEAMRKNGGYSTLGNLYHLVDTSSWTTKTPNESIRRIVQQSKETFKIQTGLWALNECRDSVLEKLELKEKDPKNEDHFTHSYYQGLVVEIGNMQNFSTYIPAQDKNKKFLETPLREVCTTTLLPEFGYREMMSRAKTIDVIWFNQRNMPNSFFEIEHSSDIQNSITKFCDLQDYYSRFIIVAPKERNEQFDKVMTRTAFQEIKGRVRFCSYEVIGKQYDTMCQMKALIGKI